VIHVDCLNNMGFRGKGKRIAVIDTRFGVADTLSAFDSLRNRGGILATWDFVWEQPVVYDDTNNTDIHGAEVLSCIAGILPGQLKGDAIDADFYLLRTEDANSEYMIEDDNWASGAEYADSAGADIITSSLGYSVFTSDPGTSYTYADMNGKVAVASMAATIATEKGLVVCVAAGNEGGSSWQYITSPGDADSILTVGAVDPFGAYATFSSTGPTSDHRIKPDVSAQGEFDALAANTGGVTFGSGTSFATPLIAGGVASLWQADSNASNYEIMQAIKQSASQYTHPDSLLGYGIPDFCLARNIIIAGEQNIVITNLNKIYPNPFADNITVSFFSSIEQNVNVKMYNTLGQIVNQTSWKVAGGGNTLINLGGLQNLSEGIYVLVVTDESGRVYTGKVVK
jgi:serine protease AprX